MNDLLAVGYEGDGSDIAPVYIDMADGSAVTPMPYTQLDISKAEVVSQDQPDFVVHFASWTVVDLAEDPSLRSKMRAINVDST